MRIMLDSDYVIEVDSITATPVWDANSTDEHDEYNPNYYIVETGEPFGEYLLDGNIETYHEARKNFKKVCKQLLEKGYCRIEEFINFELY